MNKSLKLNSNLALLHAIRGVAAFYVVVYHAKFILWSGGKEFLQQFPRSSWSITDYFLFSGDMLFSAGSQMVMIFFVLSGFFIAMSWKNITGAITDKIRYFYSVRLIRIYIPYIASIFLSVIVLLLIAEISPGLYHLNSTREFNSRLLVANADLTLSNFARGLVFNKNNEYIGFNYAYWSLLYEAIFYLFVPFIYQFKKIYFIVSALFFITGIFVIDRFRVDNIFVKFLFEYNFYFAIGQAIYIYREQISRFAQLKYFKVLAAGSSIILFFIFNVLALFHQDFWADFLSAITAALLILLFLNHDVRNSLIIKAIKKLGEMSYSLYLVHIPTIIFIYALFYKYTGKTVFFEHLYFIGVIASLVVGWVFYSFIEKPSLLLIKKLKRSLKHKPELSLKVA
ncbi:MAG: acyltransferase [Ferruginibacter sp.]